MQNEIKTERNVFDESGIVKHAGWSRQPLFSLDKAMCRNRLSLNESDSYMISNDDVSLFLSISENGITSEVTALVVDHNTGVIDHRTLKKYMSFGHLDMPSSSKNGDVTFNDARVGMNFSNTALNRYIRCEFVDFCRDKTLYINLTLESTIDESFNVLMPIKNNKRGFYLRRFLPAMRASGVIRCGGAEYKLEYSDSFATLNWQRFSLKDKAYFHALYSDTVVDGKQFSLCLAGGIGDPSMGTENCYFSNGVIHKFASVKADGKEERPDKPWHFTAGSSAMDIIFRPQMKSGHLMSSQCGKKLIVFGKIFGRISQMGTSVINLDAVPAYMEFSLY